jgi:hypothetical protein
MFGVFHLRNALLQLDHRGERFPYMRTLLEIDQSISGSCASESEVVSS